MSDTQREGPEHDADAARASDAPSTGEQERPGQDAQGTDDQRPAGEDADSAAPRPAAGGESIVLPDSDSADASDIVGGPSDSLTETAMVEPVRLGAPPPASREDAEAGKDQGTPEAPAEAEAPGDTEPEAPGDTERPEAPAEAEAPSGPKEPEAPGGERPEPAQQQRPEGQAEPAARESPEQPRGAAEQTAAAEPSEGQAPAVEAQAHHPNGGRATPAAPRADEQRQAEGESPRSGAEEEEEERPEEPEAERTSEIPAAPPEPQPEEGQHGEPEQTPPAPRGRHGGLPWEAPATASRDTWLRRGHHAGPAADEPDDGGSGTDQLPPPDVLARHYRHARAEPGESPRIVASPPSTDADSASTEVALPPSYPTHSAVERRSLLSPDRVGGPQAEHPSGPPADRAPAAPPAPAAPEVAPEPAPPAGPAAPELTRWRPRTPAAPAPASTPESLGDAIFEGATVTPNVPSRAPARAWSLLLTLLLTPVAWYLAADAGARMTVATNAPLQTGVANIAAVLELLASLGAIVLLGLIARSSALGPLVAGILVAASGTPFVVAPAWTSSQVDGPFAALRGWNSFGVNIAHHLAASGFTGRLVVLGTALILVAVVSRGARRAGASEQSVREEVARYRAGERGVTDGRARGDKQRPPAGGGRPRQGGRHSA